MKGNTKVLATLNELLESILKDEEAHIDWLETQLDQIEQMGVSTYLVEQVDEK